MEMDFAEALVWNARLAKRAALREAEWERAKKDRGA